MAKMVSLKDFITALTFLAISGVIQGQLFLLLLSSCLLHLYLSITDTAFSSLKMQQMSPLLFFSSQAYHLITSMASFSSTVLLLLISLMGASFIAVSSGTLYEDIDIKWGAERAKILNNGQLLTLSLDRTCGAGFQSKNDYLFGKIEMQLKLVPGNSAGTVTAFYLSSQGPTHDEIDFEFLGNISGDPYTVHTNVYTQGKGEREQQFRLWFDPTADFHTYSFTWNPKHIIFSVDDTPIREFKNLESIGVQYPKNQAMSLYSSLWDAEDWATRGGLVKTDWSQAPFIASYRNFNANGCIWSAGKSSCNSVSSSLTLADNSWLAPELDARSQEKLRWVQRNYMIYNYCTDTRRFPGGFPAECHAISNS